MTRLAALLLVSVAAAAGGCASLTNPVADGIPVRQLPAEVIGRPKADLRPLPLTLLRQKEPDVYRLDKGDVLAVIADDVIARPDVQPPIRLPDAQNPTAATGFPIPVDGDGMIRIPRLAPIPVKGKTPAEVEELVKDYATGKVGGVELVKPGARISVQLLQKRTYEVLVVREDGQAFQNTGGSGGGFGVQGTTKRGSGRTLHLPAGENDVLHALTETGGLPGLDAKNEVLVYRGGYDPADPGKNRTRIPLRVYPDEPLCLRDEDITLRDGDIITIEARDTELFYTAGLIGGGQYVLPRDFDLRVTDAIASVRGPLANGGFSQGALVASSTNSGLGAPSPSLCVVLRRLPLGQQIPIRVDLNRALQDPRENIIVRPGDMLVLQERPGESLARYVTQVFSFTNSARLISAPNFTGNLGFTVP